MPRYLTTPFALAYKAKGIKAEEVAKQLGLSRTYIFQIASGQRTPSLKTAARLSVLLDAPVQDLFPDIFLAAEQQKATVRKGSGVA